MPRERANARPKASRPHMPEYGIAAAKGGKGLLPWSWAVDRLERARNYWLVTTRPDGRPHSMPVWGIWMDDVFYFSTGGKSRKARNLAANPRCIVHPGSGDEAVIVEGVADKKVVNSVFLRFKKAYKKKYDWVIDRSMGPIYAVRPRVAFGMIETGGQFTKTATRWTFRKE